MDGSGSMTLPKVEERKTVNRAVTFRRERLADVVIDLGPLFRMHDRELWPGRKWGSIKPDFPYYLQMDAQNLLLLIAVRNSATRLVGYSSDFLMVDKHYGIPAATNDMFFVHPDYRGGTGLSFRSSAGFRLMMEREKMLDELKIVRRFIRPKVARMFGPLLERIGYQQSAVEFHRIVMPKENGSAQA